jgi:hypothetical protein
MPEPIYWKSKQSDEASWSSRADRKWICKVRAGVGIMACIVFLGISWLAGRSSWLLFLLLYIPCYACGEWLSGKIFSENSRLSVSRSGFSMARIVYGVIFASLLFGTIYVVGLLLSRWLL